MIVIAVNQLRLVTDRPAFLSSLDQSWCEANRPESHKAWPFKYLLQDVCPVTTLNRDDFHALHDVGLHFAAK